MPNQEGPFSEYLTKPLEQQTPRATGFEDTGANIAFIASKFLDGIRQHRAQKFAQQQIDEEKNLKTFNTMLQTVQSNPSLTAAAKQRLSAPLIQAIIGQAGSAPETGKHTGNGLTDVMKNVFTNMTGGPGPKGQKFDMGLIGQTFSAMDPNIDPDAHTSTHTSRAEQEISQYIKSMQAQGRPVSKQGLEMDPTYRAIIDRTHQALGDTSWKPRTDYLPDTDIDVLNSKAKKAYLDDWFADAATSTTATTPTTATPPSVKNASVDPGVLASAPTIIGKQSAPAATPEITLSDLRNDASRYDAKAAYAKSNGLPMPKGTRPEIPMADGTYFDPTTGELFPGVNPTTGNPATTGVYNSATGRRVPGAKSPSSMEKGTTRGILTSVIWTGDKVPANIKTDWSGNPIDRVSGSYSPIYDGSDFVGVIANTKSSRVTDGIGQNGPEKILINPYTGQSQGTGIAPMTQVGTRTQVGEDENTGVKTTVVQRNFATPPRTATNPAAPVQTAPPPTVQQSTNPPVGLITPGNIDLSNRPVVKNQDGTTSTVRTITVESDGKAILLPTVINGKVVSNDEAIAHWKQTGEHMGVFDSQANADEYDKQLHNQMGWNGAPGSPQAAWQATAAKPGTARTPATPRSTGTPRPTATPGAVTPTASRYSSDNVFASSSAAPPVQTAQNNQKPRNPNGLVPTSVKLNDRQSKVIENVRGSLRLVDQLKGLLSAVDPSTGKPFYTNKEWSDLTKRNWEAALYKMGMSPDAFSSNLTQNADLLSVIGTTPYVSGQTAQKFRSDVQAHLPKATDTPALMWEKLRTMEQFLPTVEDDVKSVAGIKIIPATPNSPPREMSPSVIKIGKKDGKLVQK